MRRIVNAAIINFMSLNWKEINLILEELNLEGAQIQKAVQSAFDVLCLKLYGRTGAKTLLISVNPGACRIHETFYSVPKSKKPLRFAEFLNSRIVNGRITEAVQLGSDRIVRLTVCCKPREEEEKNYHLYIRLWSNAANVIVTDTEGQVLDAMRRLPRKNEVSGGVYAPELNKKSTNAGEKPYEIREFQEDLLEKLPENPSFNQKIDTFYRMEGGSLSLDSLREELRKKFEKNIDRLKYNLEKLKEKEADFSRAERFKEYGDLIFSNMSIIRPLDEWLETKSFNEDESETIRIKLDPKKGPAASAQDYYEQYRKAKSGLTEIQGQIEKGNRELGRLEETLQSLLSESNPLVLNKLLKSGASMFRGKASLTKSLADANESKLRRPGISFRRNDWLIIVGRDATENDSLLRKYVKGNDIWLHARDYPGAYVFIKQRSGKTVPLDILLDAGNLAIFYSKGRNSGGGSLFYTPVKYLRRAKNGPKGLVIPTQEKNLEIKLDSERLRVLEECRVEK